MAVWSGVAMPWIRWRRSVSDFARDHPWPAVVTALCLGLGIAVRFRFGLSSKAGFDSDEAVVGLLGNSNLHGRFLAFYPGQQYGGTIGAVGIAASQWLLGRTFVALRLAAFVESISLIPLMATLSRRYGADLWRAVALASLWPLGYVAFSVREMLFYNSSLIAICSLWILTIDILAGDRSLTYYQVIAGVLAGVAWWSTPQSVPIVATLVMYFVISTRKRQRPALVWLRYLFGFVAGSVPWLVRNIATGLASLKPGAVFADPLPYWKRLLIALRGALLRPVGDVTTGNSWSERPYWPVLLLGCLLVAGVVVAARRGRLAVPITTLILFPIISAINPLVSIQTVQYRYSYFVWPIMTILIAVLITCHRNWGRVASICVVVAMAIGSGRQLPWKEQPHVARDAMARELAEIDEPAILGSYWDVFSLRYLCDDRCPQLLSTWILRPLPGDPLDPSTIDVVLTSPNLQLAQLTPQLDARHVAYTVQSLSQPGFALVHLGTPMDRGFLSGVLG